MATFGSIFEQLTAHRSKQIKTSADLTNALLFELVRQQTYTNELLRWQCDHQREVTR